MQSLALFRTKEWLHFLGFPLLGYFATGRAVSIDLAWVLASAALCLAYAYSLNDVIDRRLDRRKLLVPAITLPLLAVGGILLAGHRRWTLLAAVVIWTFYSLPPIRLKALPVISTLTNGIGFPLFYLLGLRAVEGRSLLFAGALACLLVAAQLIHEICHVEEDEREEIRTTVVSFGAGVGRVGVVLMVLAATALAFLHRPVFAIAVGIGALGTIIALRFRSPTWVRSATRIGGAVIGLLLLGWQLAFPG